MGEKWWRCWVLRNRDHLGLICPVYTSQRWPPSCSTVFATNDSFPASYFPFIWHSFLYVAESQYFHFDHPYVCTVFSRTSTVVFIVFFCFPHSVAAEHSLGKFLFYESFLCPLQLHKNINQTITMGHSNNVDEPAKSNTIYRAEIETSSPT